MKELAIIVGLACCQSVFAEPANEPSPSPKVQVHQLRPDYDVSGLKSPDVQIHPYQKTRTASVNRKEREQALKQAGLSAAVKNWDELDRDVFYLKAQTLSIEKFAAQYPKIDQPALKKFYEVVNECPSHGGDK